ncbi:MAG: hypothetical protein PVJ09_03645 [Candidatus Woesebacteria bacterium]|jgi:hypothetical protein
MSEEKSFLRKPLNRREWLKGTASMVGALVTGRRLFPGEEATAQETSSLESTSSPEPYKELFVQTGHADLPPKEPDNLWLSVDHVQASSAAGATVVSRTMDTNWGIVGEMFLERAVFDNDELGRVVILERELGYQVPIYVLNWIEQSTAAGLSSIAYLGESGFVWPDDGRGLYWVAYNTDGSVANHEVIAPWVYRDAYNYEAIDNPILSSRITTDIVFIVYKRHIVSNGVPSDQIEAISIKTNEDGSRTISEPVIMVEEALPGYTDPYGDRFSLTLVPGTENTYQLTCLTYESISSSRVKSQFRVEDGNLRTKMHTDEGITAGDQDGRIRQAQIELDPRTGEFSILREEGSDGLACRHNSNFCITPNHQIIKADGERLYLATSAAEDASWQPVADLTAYGVNFLSSPSYIRLGRQDLIVVRANHQEGATLNYDVLVAIDLKNPEVVYRIKNVDVYNARYFPQVVEGQLILGSIAINDEDRRHAEVDRFKPEYTVNMPFEAKMANH